MRTFTLVRKEDFSGVSGTGEVAKGVQFDNGKCVMCWDTATSSIAVYENVEELISIHGHEGRTVVVFDDTGETVSDIVDKKLAGLYHKYNVYVAEPDGSDGVPVDSWVFVLKPDSDYIARRALREYARCADTAGYVKLADDIFEQIDRVSPEDEVW